MKQLFTTLLFFCAALTLSAQTTLPSLHVDGKWLVDTYGNHVVLHGVMDTPSNWFNGYQDATGHHSYWQGSYDANGAKNCKAYFHKLFGAMQQSNCDVFRLHLDPAWTNDGSVTYVKLADQPEHSNGKLPTNEADISHFNPKRLATYLKQVYVPLMMDALEHGMYVVVRPPGVCPDPVWVNGYYQKYLIEVWDSVSKNETIRRYAGQISLELANEPVGVKNASGQDDAKALRDFFQPVVDKIRENGFTGIIWIPGSGWQSQYANYKTYPVKDKLNNFGYAVHDYDGWYGLEDKKNTPSTVTQATKNKITQFHNQVPVVDTNPIIVTEIDWSPKKSDVPGHENEHGQQVEGNLGTWATGKTSVWGTITKNVYDYYGNISMTLSGSHCLFDIQTLLKTGEVVPAFDGEPEACGKACMDWYAEYAKVNNPVADWVNTAPISDLGDGKYQNPVVRADFPDPDVIRVGDTYYMVSTTMSLFPGATIIKSKDMVNWEYCAQPLKQLSTDHDGYLLKNGKTAYACGMWAPSMKYYKGKFYILICERYPVEQWILNGWLLTAEDPEGTWTAKKLSRAYYDPGMLFDNDKVYIVQGINNLSVCELDKNFNFKQEKTVITRADTGLEGSHFYKKGKYYYIYSTYGGIPSGQTIFRSTNPFGPYEEAPNMIVEKEINGKFNTVHQGSLIQDVKGNWWTIMQEDLGALGRFPNLQPVKWVDDWPVVGNNGVPYETYNKPATNEEYPLTKYMPTTDNFRTYPLGMQWEWNHTPDDDGWSLFRRPGWLRLATTSVAGTLPMARNMLTQRIFMDKSKATTGTVRLDVSALQEGDRAGICIFQDPFGAIAVEMKNGKYMLVWFQDKVKGADANSAMQKYKEVELTDNIVYLRGAIKFGENKARFYYSTDNKTWSQLGEETSQGFSLNTFFGARFGLFCYSTKLSGGYADFDWFSTESDYDEQALYGEFKSTLDENMLTATKIVPSKKIIDVMMGGSNSSGIVATYKDKHTESVTSKCSYEPETPGIVELTRGQIKALSLGKTRVAVSFTDDFGNKLDTAFTARVSYFPFDQQYVTTAFSGAGEGTFKFYDSTSTGDYALFKFPTTDTYIGWAYSKKIDLSSYHYMVIKFKTKPTTDFTFNIHIASKVTATHCAVPLGRTLEQVISLDTLKYTTSGSNYGKAVTRKSISMVTFASKTANKNLYISEILLYADDPTGINEVAWKQERLQRQTVSVYTMSGRMVRHAVKRSEALQGLPAGLYLMDGEKVLVK